MSSGPRIGQAGEDLGLGNVGRDDGRQRQQLLCQRLDGVRLQEPGPGGRDHDGVLHDPLGLVEPQPFGNCFNELRRGDHPDLHGIRADVREDAVDLLTEKFGSDLQNSLYAGGVLRRERRNRAHGVHPVHGHRFQIGLNPGASAAVAASDG
jgi:hypothetical protein